LITWQHLSKISAITSNGREFNGGRGNLPGYGPNALKVYAIFDFTDANITEPVTEDTLLVKNDDGHWTGFFPGIGKGQQYMFYVVGNNPTSGPKRDPYARALPTQHTLEMYYR